MSDKQWRTLSLLERLERGELTVSEVAASLGKSRRQVQRIRKRVLLEGKAAVVHGNTGRAPANKTGAELEAWVLELRRDKYRGFNDQHFTEKLAQNEGISLSRETVRRMLRGGKVPSPRTRRPPKHRSRRPRRAQPGQLVLWDGSRHDWLEGRGPKLCLMGAIDDATGEFLSGAHFTEREGTVGYLKLLRGMMVNKGIPQTVYSDRHGSLKRNDSHWSLEEELAGKREPTQVARALREMDVGIHYALSAQAKGRVERLWGTLQDRLVSELRLANAKTRGQANQLLERYRLEHNKRFAIAAANADKAWRKAPSDHTQILDLCSLHYIRKVRKNHTVQVDGHVIDLPKRRDAVHASYAGKRVIIKHHLNGHYRVFYDGELLAWDETGKRPKSPGRGARTLLGADKRDRQKAERERKSNDQEEDWG